MCPLDLALWPGVIQIKVTQPDPDGPGYGQPAPVTEYAYDALGRMTSMTSALDGLTTYEYDALGRQTKVTLPDPAGDPQSPCTVSSYDAVGNLEWTENALGEQTAYTYGNLNRLLTVTDPETGLTTYSYDAAGNRVTLTDPEDNTTTWTYDALGRVIEEENELASSRLFEYDAAGNLTKKTDRNGRVIEYVYDDLNRNTQELWKDGQTIVRTVTFAYDAANRLTQSSDPDGAIQYWYDNLGRTTKTIQTIAGLTPSVELRYAYDSASNCTSLMAYLGGVYNSANVYSTCYDNLNRLRRVYQAGAGATVTPKLAYFTFDALDRLTVINRGEYDDQSSLHWTVTDSYAFDADSRLTGLTHLKGPTTLASYTWTYDRASRPTGFTTQYADQNFDDDTGDFTYDETGQLTSADYDYQTDEAYSYDANGNRTNTGYDTDANNRLASDGVYDYEYDDEGNRTRRTRISDESVTEYTWDHRNRLTSVTERAGGVGMAATKVVEYKYDLNERLVVGKTLDPDGAGEEEASEEYYAYDQTPFSTRENASQMLFRFEGSELSDLKSRYLWAPVVDLLLSDEKLTGPSTPGDIYWALGDNLNTVRDIARYNPSTDTTTIVNHRVYDAFGKLTSETNAAVDLIFGFTGRLFDDATGLQNNLHRWYDPTIGRWLSEDPIGFSATDVNLYRYCANASTIHLDPTGTYIYLAKGQRGRWDPVGVLHQDIAADTWRRASGGASGGWVHTGTISYSFGTSGGTDLYPRQYHWLGFSDYFAVPPLFGMPSGRYLAGRIYVSSYDPNQVFSTIRTLPWEDVQWHEYMGGRKGTPDRYSPLWWNCVNYTNHEFGRAMEMFGFT